MLEVAQFFFPAATYNIDAQIEMHHTVHMVGAGSPFTLFDYSPDSTAPALIMGDAAFRSGGGVTTNKNWNFRGIRLQTSNGSNQKTGLYIIGVYNALLQDVQVVDFDATDAYGILFSGNPSIELGETSVNVEGHYNTLISVYCIGNYNGLGFRGVSTVGQSNDNTIFGGAFRQNTNYNVHFAETNNCSIYGSSVESVGATQYGIYFDEFSTDNKAYGVRFEGTYLSDPFFFEDNSTTKRNAVDLPVYGSGYPRAEPIDSSFAVDPGARNHMRTWDQDSLMIYGPGMTFVAPTGDDISFNFANNAVARMGDNNGFDGFRMLKGFVIPTGSTYPGTETQGAIFLDTDVDVPFIRTTAPEQTFKELAIKVTAPTSGVSAGEPGMWGEDNSFLYICTSSASWSRTTLDTF